MNGSLVRRGAALPLYHQVFSDLRDKILSGVLPFGAMLPTEFQIIEAFGVSRTTARSAVRRLRDIGLVERRRSTGTRVIHKAAQSTLAESPEATIQSLVAFAHATTVTLIEFGAVAGSPEELAALQLPSGSHVLRAVRTRAYRGEPLGVITSIMPAAAEAYVSVEKLRKTPLLQVLLDQGYTIDDGMQTITVCGASMTLAEQLGIPPQAPVLCIERLLRGADGLPLARTMACYRGDRYKVVLGLEAVPHPLVETSF